MQLSRGFPADDLSRRENQPEFTSSLAAGFNLSALLLVFQRDLNSYIFLK